MKKASLANRSIKYGAPEFIFKNTTIKDIRHNDIWKLGILLLQVLLGEDLKKQVLGLENVDEEKVHTYKIVSDDRANKLKKVYKANFITEIVKTLNYVPSERKNLEELIV